MESRGLIAGSVWICVTILSVVIIWITQQLDLWTAFFILLLLGGAFVTTFAVLWPDFWGKQPERARKGMEGRIEEMSKQLEELSKTVDYIKKQLEE